ncbi:Cellulosome-anchoring protein precursor [Pelotomaculum schinkii]|uniref:Cellulosome-anchoring protein n=1 Tax=Pelotomaculum schinkii TaxID=78350 RepID=A0A4Y7RGG5_9FIRM|nr:S-layer homology domain-containing protein [Pelotomaculum schinkii]TEB07840.1 Cellulosome-anchoring protein precursor [Pelotomaculum schinkii]
MNIGLAKYVGLGLLSFFFLLFAFSRSLPAGAASITEDAVRLTDLQGHWARTQITRLVALEVVSGYPDHTFLPDQQISQLETTVLILRSGGFTAEAERLTSGGLTATPRVPWGQQYLDLAVQKGFLSYDAASDFDFAAPATRLWTAKLLARVLYLTPPASKSGTATDVKDLPEGTGYTLDKVFSDVMPVDSDDQACIRAVAAAGVMSGYPDGTFRPFGCLTRAEMSVIISRLAEQGWVRMNAGRSLTGWISGIETQRGSMELELTSFGKAQRFKVAQGVYCLNANQEYPIERAAGYIGEIILDKSKKVSWVNLLQQKNTVQNPVKIRGSVKSVALGNDNLLIVSDLNCTERILHLAWDTVVAGEKAPKDLASLKAGTFVDVEIDSDRATRIELLEVKNISGQVEKLGDRRLYLKGTASAKKPGWFNNYEFARMVDKEGVRKDGILPGEKVQVTYLDPFPGEIDDEIPLEIKVM